MNKSFLTLLLVLLPLFASANPVEIDGIYYNLNSNDGENVASVTSNPNYYSGDIVIPESVTYEDVIYSVTSVDNSAFAYCGTLSSITFPYTLKSIANNAFKDCLGLTAVYITDLKAWCNMSIAGSIYGESSPLSYAHHLYLNGKEIIDLVIPEGVSSINSWTFMGCSELTSVKIPSSIKEIGVCAFSGCENLNKIIIEDIEAWCKISFARNTLTGSISNPLINANHLYYEENEISELIIPNSITTINDYSFAGCCSFTSICFGDKVTSIGEGAFSGCSGLIKVDTKNVEGIGRSAFGGCNGLTSVTIGDKVTSIGEGAFYGCSGLIKVDIPKGITSIQSNTFSNCSGLLTVTIPEGLTQICYGAFRDCSNLTNINIPTTITSIGEYSFSGCSSLAIELVIPEGVTDIPTAAFERCSGISSITIPKSLVSIGRNAFSGCTNLKGVKISDLEAWCRINFDLNYFYSNPLFYANNLILNGDTIKELVIPEKVETISKGAFYRCSSLVSLYFHSNILSIDENTFYGCSGLKSISFSEALSTIRKSAFENCSNIENVTIPAAVEVIYQEAFAGCSSLKSVKSLAETPPFLYDNSFSNYDIPLYVPEASIDSYKAKDGWKNFKDILSIDAAKFTLTYMVDGDVYKTYELYEGTTIVPEAEPTKDGYDFSGWSTIPSTMPAEDVTITGTFKVQADEDVIKITSVGQTTWCSAYDLDFTDIEGLKAYIASGYHRTKGTIWLTRVKEVPAGEGILLIGDEGEYKVPHKSTTAYYANLMVGTVKAITINETDGEYTNYYLSNGASGVGFYKVNGSVEIKANRAYLPLLKNTVSGTRGFIGMDFDDDEDGTTGIEVQSSIFNVQSKDVYYNLQGQRVDNPSKGLYIRNGKKVVIK